MIKIKSLSKKICAIAISLAIAHITVSAYETTVITHETKTVSVAGTTSRDRVITVTLPTTATVTSVTVDTGIVSYTQNGTSVTLNLSEGIGVVGSYSYYDSKAEMRGQEDISTRTTNSFPDNAPYNVGGFSGTLYKSGNSFPLDQATIDRWYPTRGYTIYMGLWSQYYSGTVYKGGNVSGTGTIYPYNISIDYSVNAYVSNIDISPPNIMYSVDGFIPEISSGFKNEKKTIKVDGTFSQDREVTATLPLTASVVSVTSNTGNVSYTYENGNIVLSMSDGVGVNSSGNIGDNNQFAKTVTVSAPEQSSNTSFPDSWNYNQDEYTGVLNKFNNVYVSSGDYLSYYQTDFFIEVHCASYVVYSGGSWGSIQPTYVFPNSVWHTCGGAYTGYAGTEDKTNLVLYHNPPSLAGLPANPYEGQRVDFGTSTGFKQYYAGWVYKDTRKYSQDYKGVVYKAGTGTEENLIYPYEVTINYTTTVEGSGSSIIGDDTTIASAKVDLNVTDQSGVFLVKWAEGDYLGDNDYFATGGIDITSSTNFEVFQNGVYTVYAEDILGNKTTVLVNITSAGFIKLTLPISLTANINPNDSESLDNSFSIINNSSSSVNVNFSVVAGADTPAKVVEHNKFADWTKLNCEETKSNIAFGIDINNTTNWLKAEGTGESSAISIAKDENKLLNLKVLHGYAWDGDYSLNYIFKVRVALS